MAGKVYIAGKITGDPNYREKFAKVEEKLKSKGYTVMNPAILPEGFEYEEYMNITGAMLMACDYICLLEDWADSKGASLEANTANARRYGYVSPEGELIREHQKTPNKNNH